jgi:protein daughter of sevenless
MIYYENQDQAKKKGSIDLNNCDEVRDSLDSVYYKHLFSIRTSRRTYYLAADTETDMNSWVDHLIRVLGLNDEGWYCVLLKLT